MRVGIIGGGIAGLTLATRLAEAGHSALVLDKGQGIGGRISQPPRHDRAFDHGAQYFTVRDPRFRDFLDSHVPPTLGRAGGAIRDPRGRPARPRSRRPSPISSASPGCPTSPGRSPSAAGDPDDRGWSGSGRRARALDPDRRGGRRRRAVRLGGRDRPAGPVRRPARGSSPIAAEIAGVAMQPCFALMIAPSNGASLPVRRHPLPTPGPGLGRERPLQAGPGPEPGRCDPFEPRLGPGPPRRRASDDRRGLHGAASEAFGVDFGADRLGTVHRWLYARPAEPLGQPAWSTSGPAGRLRRLVPGRARSRGPS